MTLEQACELAKAIEGNSEFAVIAIGRFVMTDELSSESKKNLSWGISLVYLRDRERAVIHKESEWTDFAKAVCKSAKRTKSVEDSAPKQQAKPVYDEHQLELF